MAFCSFDLVSVDVINNIKQRSPELMFVVALPLLISFGGCISFCVSSTICYLASYIWEQFQPEMQLVFYVSFDQCKCRNLRG